MFSPSRPPALCPSGPSLQLSRTSDSESVILSGVGRRKWCQHEGCVAVRDVLTVNVIIADATECVRDALRNLSLNARSATSETGANRCERMTRGHRQGSSTICSRTRFKT